METINTGTPDPPKEVLERGETLYQIFSYLDKDEKGRALSGDLEGILDAIRAEGVEVISRGPLLPTYSLDELSFFFEEVPDHALTEILWFVESVQNVEQIMKVEHDNAVDKWSDLANRLGSAGISPYFARLQPEKVSQWLSLRIKSGAAHSKYISGIDPSALVSATYSREEVAYLFKSSSVSEILRSLEIMKPFSELFDLMNDLCSLAVDRRSSAGDDVNGDFGASCLDTVRQLTSFVSRFRERPDIVRGWAATVVHMGGLGILSSLVPWMNAETRKLAVPCIQYLLAFRFESREDPLMMVCKSAVCYFLEIASKRQMEELEGMPFSQDGVFSGKISDLVDNVLNAGGDREMLIDLLIAMETERLGADRVASSCFLTKGVLHVLAMRLNLSTHKRIHERLASLRANLIKFLGLVVRRPHSNEFALECVNESGILESLLTILRGDFGLPRVEIDESVSDTHLPWYAGTEQPYELEEEDFMGTEGDLVAAVLPGEKGVDISDTFSKLNRELTYYSDDFESSGVKFKRIHGEIPSVTEDSFVSAEYADVDVRAALQFFMQAKPDLVGVEKSNLLFDELYVGAKIIEKPLHLVCLLRNARHLSALWSMLLKHPSFPQYLRDYASYYASLALPHVVLTGPLASTNILDMSVSHLLPTPLRTLADGVCEGALIPMPKLTSVQKGSSVAGYKGKAVDALGKNALLMVGCTLARAMKFEYMDTQPSEKEFPAKPPRLDALPTEQEELPMNVLKQFVGSLHVSEDDVSAILNSSEALFLRAQYLMSLFRIRSAVSGLASENDETETASLVRKLRTISSILRTNVECLGYLQIRFPVSYFWRRKMVEFKSLREHIDLALKSGFESELEPLCQLAQDAKVLVFDRVDLLLRRSLLLQFGNYTIPDLLRSVGALMKIASEADISSTSVEESDTFQLSLVRQQILSYLFFFLMFQPESTIQLINAKTHALEERLGIGSGDCVDLAERLAFLDTSRKSKNGAKDEDPSTSETRLGHPSSVMKSLSQRGRVRQKPSGEKDLSDSPIQFHGSFQGVRVASVKKGSRFPPICFLQVNGRWFLWGGSAQPSSICTVSKTRKVFVQDNFSVANVANKER